MSLDLLKKQIAEGNFSRYYYFSGQCLYLKRFYLESLKKAMIPEEAYTTDVIIPDIKEVTAEDLSDMAGNVSLQSERKMIILKDLPLSSDIFKYLIKDPDMIPEGTAVVFISEYLKYDTRLKSYKEFESFIKKEGLSVEVEQPDRGTLVKWVAQNFRKLGKAISEQDIHYLLDNTDNEMYALKNEIDKLASATLEQTVTRKNIDSLCIFTLESNSFKITDAILNRDADTAYSVINDLIQLGTDPNMLLGVIYKAVTNLCKIKMLADQGCSVGEIASATKIRDFIINRDLRRLRGISSENLMKAAEACIEADLESKTSSSDGVETITKLIALCLTVI